MTTVEVLEGDGARLVGQAHFTRTRGQISTTFLYDAGYLAGGGMGIGGRGPHPSTWWGERG